MDSEMFGSWLMAIEQQMSVVDICVRIKMDEYLYKLRHSVKPLDLARKRKSVLATERRLVTEAAIPNQHEATGGVDPRRREDDLINERLQRLTRLMQVHRKTHFSCCGVDWIIV